MGDKNKYSKLNAEDSKKFLDIKLSNQQKKNYRSCYFWVELFNSLSVPMQNEFLNTTFVNRVGFSVRDKYYNKLAYTGAVSMLINNRPVIQEKTVNGVKKKIKSFSKANDVITILNTNSKLYIDNGFIRGQDKRKPGQSRVHTTISEDQKKPYNKHDVVIRVSGYSPSENNMTQDVIKRIYATEGKAIIESEGKKKLVKKKLYILEYLDYTRDGKKVYSQLRSEVPFNSIQIVAIKDEMSKEEYIRRRNNFDSKESQMYSYQLERIAEYFLVPKEGYFEGSYADYLQAVDDKKVDEHLLGLNKVFENVKANKNIKNVKQNLAQTVLSKKEIEHRKFLKTLGLGKDKNGVQGSWDPKKHDWTKWNAQPVNKVRQVKKQNGKNLLAQRETQVKEIARKYQAVLDPRAYEKIVPQNNLIQSVLHNLIYSKKMLADDLKELVIGVKKLSQEDFERKVENLTVDLEQHVKDHNTILQPLLASLIALEKQIAPVEMRKLASQHQNAIQLADPVKARQSQSKLNEFALNQQNALILPLTEKANELTGLTLERLNRAQIIQLTKNVQKLATDLQAKKSQYFFSVSDYTKTLLAENKGKIVNDKKPALNNVRRKNIVVKRPLAKMVDVNDPTVHRRIKLDRKPSHFIEGIHDNAHKIAEELKILDAKHSKGVILPSDRSRKFKGTRKQDIFLGYAIGDSNPRLNDKFKFNGRKGDDISIVFHPTLLKNRDQSNALNQLYVHESSSQTSHLIVVVEDMSQAKIIGKTEFRAGSKRVKEHDVMFAEGDASFESMVTLRKNAFQTIHFVKLNKEGDEIDILDKMYVLNGDKKYDIVHLDGTPFVKKDPVLPPKDEDKNKKPPVDDGKDGGGDKGDDKKPPLGEDKNDGGDKDDDKDKEVPLVDPKVKKRNDGLVIEIAAVDQLEQMDFNYSKQGDNKQISVSYQGNVIYGPTDMIRANEGNIRTVINDIKIIKKGQNGVQDQLVYRLESDPNDQDIFKLYAQAADQAQPANFYLHVPAVVFGGNKGDVFGSSTGNNTFIGRDGDDVFGSLKGGNRYIGGKGYDTFAINMNRSEFEVDVIQDEDAGEIHLTRMKRNTNISVTHNVDDLALISLVNDQQDANDKDTKSIAQFPFKTVKKIVCTDEKGIPFREYLIKGSKFEGNDRVLDMKISEIAANGQRRVVNAEKQRRDLQEVVDNRFKWDAANGLFAVNLKKKSDFVEISPGLDQNGKYSVDVYQRQEGTTPKKLYTLECPKEARKLITIVNGQHKDIYNQKQGSFIPHVINIGELYFMGLEGNRLQIISNDQNIQFKISERTGPASYELWAVKGEQPLFDRSVSFLKQGNTPQIITHFKGDNGNKNKISWKLEGNNFVVTDMRSESHSTERMFAPDGAQYVASGGRKDDEIHGGDFSDTLHGGSGKDTFYPGNGDDKIYGGIDDDTLELSPDETGTKTFNDIVDFGGGNQTIVYRKVDPKKHQVVIDKEKGRFVALVDIETGKVINKVVFDAKESVFTIVDSIKVYSGIFQDETLIHDYELQNGQMGMPFYIDRKAALNDGGNGNQGQNNQQGLNDQQQLQIHDQGQGGDQNAQNHQRQLQQTPQHTYKIEAGVGKLYLTHPEKLENVKIIDGMLENWCCVYNGKNYLVNRAEKGLKVIDKNNGKIIANYVFFGMNKTDLKLIGNQIEYPKTLNNDFFKSVALQKISIDNGPQKNDQLLSGLLKENTSFGRLIYSNQGVGKAGSLHIDKPGFHTIAIANQPLMITSGDNYIIDQLGFENQYHIDTRKIKTLDNMPFVALADVSKNDFLNISISAQQQVKLTYKDVENVKVPTLEVKMSANDQEFKPLLTFVKGLSKKINPFKNFSVTQGNGENKVTTFYERKQDGTYLKHNGR